MAKKEKDEKSSNIILCFLLCAVAAVIITLAVIHFHSRFVSEEKGESAVLEKGATPTKRSTLMEELEERRKFEQEVETLKTGYFKLEEFWNQPLNVKVRHLKYIAGELHRKIPYIPSDVLFLNIAGIVLEYGAQRGGKGYEEYREYLRKRYPGVLFKPAERRLLLLSREASSVIFWSRPVRLIEKDVDEVVKAFVETAEYIKGRRLTEDEIRKIEHRVYTYVLGAGFRNIDKESYRKLAESKGFKEITEFFYEQIKSATESK